MQVRAKGIELLLILLEQYTSWSIVRFVQAMLLKSLVHAEYLQSASFASALIKNKLSAW